MGSNDSEWLARFHEGDRAIIEQIYRDHFDAVDRAAGAVLSGADRETVVHEVFYRLLTQKDARSSFRGGSLPSWLATIARNRAIDFARKHRREKQLSPADAAELAGSTSSRVEASIDSKRLLERIKQTLAPDQWPLFEARFLDGLSQRDAAQKLGVRRTTLAYRELRIRAALDRLLRKDLTP